MASAVSIAGSMRSGRAVAFEPDQIWQMAREPVFWLDPTLKLVWANRAWENLTGCRIESVIGVVCQAHCPSRVDDLTDVAAGFRPPPESLMGEPAGTRSLILHVGGEKRWCRLEFWPFQDERGVLIGILGVVRTADSSPSVPDSQANRLHVELIEIKQNLQSRFGFDSLVGFGPAHVRLLAQVRLAGAATIPVLIIGESGTGKRHVARMIHQNGTGRHHPLVHFDCEALPAEILERELFGAGQTLDIAHPIGDVMADAPARPRLSLREGSTLLIREISMLHRDLQERLTASLDLPVRLIATTTTDPKLSVKNEQLRLDLYFALTALVVRLEPLRERRDELPLLAQNLLARANERGAKQRAGFSSDALSALMSYDWPGNLRELARVVDHAHAAGEDPLVSIDDLPASIRGNLGGAFCPPPRQSPVKPLDELLMEVERRLIETAFRQARGNKSKAAELLGISRPRLYRRIKELNVPDEGSEDDESRL